MKKLIAAAVVVASSWSGVAIAAEALLLRHEVVTVKVGTELDLRPGFFIGKAVTLDPAIGAATQTEDQRGIKIRATAPGRTLVSAYNLRESNKRVEFEVIVVEN